MEFLLGIEGGGTKTDFAFTPLDGPPGQTVRAGGSSLSRRAAPEVAMELWRGCELALGANGAQAEECLAVCAGFASAGRQADWYVRTLQVLLPRARVQVMTDAELAWQAATRGGDGIVVIAGTGSIAWGGFQGRQARAGGAGPGLDPGSGDWIGREAVAAGLVPAPGDGDFAGLVPEVWRDHGGAAEGILRRAAEALGGLLEDCARQLCWEEPVGYWHGGVLAALPELRQYLGEVWPHPLRPCAATPLERALERARELLR